MSHSLTQDLAEQILGVFSGSSSLVLIGKGCDTGKFQITKIMKADCHDHGTVENLVFTAITLKLQENSLYQTKL